MTQEAKVAAYSDIPGFLSRCFGEDGQESGVASPKQSSSRKKKPPGFLVELMEIVASMGFDEEPNYEAMRQILKREIGKGGGGGESASESEDEEVSFRVNRRRSPLLANGGEVNGGGSIAARHKLKAVRRLRKGWHVSKTRDG